MYARLLKSLLVVVLLAAIAVVAMYRHELDVEVVKNRIEEAGVIAPLIFMLLYMVATVLFFPGSVLTLLGGALFGPLAGTFYNLTAATLGAMLSFLIARYLVAEQVERKAGGRIKQLMSGVEKEGWRFVAFTRLVPLFPFNLLNYSLGLTKISFWQYSLATYVFMLPGAVAYTYLGYIGKEAATGGEALIQKIMIALALLAVVAFMPRFIRQLRQGGEQGK